MRVIDKTGKTITKYDLTAGKLCPIKTIREDATPIDNDTKFAYTSEDYEEAMIYIPNKEKSPKEKIATLKKKLSATDYPFIKSAECLVLGLEMPYDMAELEKLRAERQAYRDEINSLEQEA